MDSATPLWVTLLVAALGIAGTLLAALIATSTTSRREAARAREEIDREIERAREEIDREAERTRDALDREAERSRAQSEREDLSQWLVEKRVAYSEFLTTSSRWQRYIEAKRDQRLARNGGMVPIDAAALQDAVDRSYAAIQVIGDASTQESANAIYHGLVITMVHLEATHFSVNRVDEGCQLVTQQMTAYLAAVRQDLAIDAATPLTA